MPASELIVIQVFLLVPAVVTFRIEVFPGIERHPKIRVPQILLYAIRLADQVDIVAGKVGEIRRHQLTVCGAQQAPHLVIPQIQQPRSRRHLRGVKMLRHIADQPAHIFEASLSAIGSQQIRRISFPGLFLNHQVPRQLVGLHLHELHRLPPTFFLVLFLSASFTHVGTVFVPMGFLQQKKGTIQIMVRSFVCQGGAAGAVRTQDTAVKHDRAGVDVAAGNSTRFRILRFHRAEAEKVFAQHSVFRKAPILQLKSHFPDPSFRIERLFAVNLFGHPGIQNHPCHKRIIRILQHGDQVLIHGDSRFVLCNQAFLFIQNHAQISAVHAAGAQIEAVSQPERLT